MKKLLFFGSAIASLLSPIKAWADTPIPIIIKNPGYGYADLGDFINKVIMLVFIFAVLFVLIMIIWGAIEWIFSGGDKEALGKARGRIVNAMIGLAFLAVAFALTKVGAQFLGFDLGRITIPAPDPTPTS